MTVEEGPQSWLNNEELARASVVRTRLLYEDPTYREDLFLKEEYPDNTPSLEANKISRWILKLDLTIPLDYMEAKVYLQTAYQSLITKLRGDKKAVPILLADEDIPIVNSRRKIIIPKGHLSFNYNQDNNNPEVSGESGVDIYHTFFIKGNKTRKLAPVVLYNTTSLKPDGALTVCKYPEYGPGNLSLYKETFQILPESKEWPDINHYQAFLYAQDLIQTYLHWDSLPHKIIRTLKTLAAFGR